MADDKPIRILCVFSTLDRGGAESMCMNLYRQIDRSRIQFDFVKHTPERGIFEDEIEALCGRVFEAPRYKIYNRLQYEKWWHAHLEAHPEHAIIHGHFFTISSVYFKVCKQHGRTTIAHSHCTSAPKSIIDNRLKRYFKDKYIRTISEYADIQLACSRQAGLDVFGDTSFDVLNNAIDAEVYRANQDVAEAVRSEFGLGNQLVVGSVGRFDLQKNPYGVLEIFRQPHMRKPDSRFLWVGDGPLRAEIVRKTEEYKIDDAVIFTGVRNDVHRLLQGMDAFIFPSFYEGLGVAAVEAQAAGVYTYCSSAVPEEVKVTNLCKLLELNNLDKWVSEIENIIPYHKHPDTYMQIKKAGYDIHDTAKWLEELYLSI